MTWMLIRNGHIFDPDDRGVADLLIVDERIGTVGTALPVPTGIGEGESLDVTGQIVLPGLIDGHLHVMGGSGMGGPKHRTTDLQLEHIVSRGVTTVVSPLGADSLSRTVPGLLGRAAALEAEGIGAYCYTGGFQHPAPTLTGSLQADVTFVDRILGAKVAISNALAPAHSLDDLCRLAHAVYTGGRMAGKGAVLHTHIGDQPEGLMPLVEVQRRTGIPPDRLVATHVSRHPELWRQALDYARGGGSIDVTGMERPETGYPQAIPAAKAIMEALTTGIPPARITLSSDSGTAYPRLDAAGHVMGQYMAGPESLLQTMRELARDGLSWGQAASFCTAHVSDVLGLSRKGYLRPGRDADLLLLTTAGEVEAVVARGRFLVRAGEAVVRGSFSGHPPA
ncbi:MAG: amidohydrolase family protein [Candidatus Methylomirabilia bacterium]